MLHGELEAERQAHVAARARQEEGVRQVEALERQLQELRTRIVLAGADFGRELTTAVMWLIERGLDIRCVRLKPYKMDTGSFTGRLSAIGGG